MNHASARIAFALAAAALVASPLAALAEPMSSTNYRVPFDAIGAGGERSTSTNYAVEDTIAELGTPTGEDLTSSNYRACVGYQCLSAEAPSLSVSYAVQSVPCTSGSASAPPYAVALGTLSPASVTTSADRLCVRVTSNVAGAIAVRAAGDNGALRSVSVPSDEIDSVTATLTAGVTGMGYCSSNAQNGFSAAAPFNGSCDLSTGHQVGEIPAATMRTIWTATGPVTDAFGELLTKAAVSSTVAAHSDYRETLTVTVTSTY